MSKTTELNKAAVAEKQSAYGLSSEITESFLNGIITELEILVEEFTHKSDIEMRMTGKERQRLFGVKSRSHGFISRALLIARENPGFTPPKFSLADMTELVREFEQVNQISLLLEQFQHLIHDYHLLVSDKAYRDALRVYGNLREMTHAKVPGAEALYTDLMQYFTLRRKVKGQSEDEPIEHEVERDYKRLIKGE